MPGPFRDGQRRRIAIPPNLFFGSVDTNQRRLAHSRNFTLVDLLVVITNAGDMTTFRHPINGDWLAGAP